MTKSNLNYSQIQPFNPFCNIILTFQLFATSSSFHYKTLNLSIIYSIIFYSLLSNFPTKISKPSSFPLLVIMDSQKHLFILSCLSLLLVLLSGIYYYEFVHFFLWKHVYEFMIIKIFINILGSHVNSVKYSLVLSMNINNQYIYSTF